MPHSTDQYITSYIQIYFCGCHVHVAFQISHHMENVQMLLAPTPKIDFLPRAPESYTTTCVRLTPPVKKITRHFRFFGGDHHSYLHREKKMAAKILTPSFSRRRRHSGKKMAVNMEVFHFLAAISLNCDVRTTNHSAKKFNLKKFEHNKSNVCGSTQRQNADMLGSYIFLEVLLTANGWCYARKWNLTVFFSWRCDTF